MLYNIPGDTGSGMYFSLDDSFRRCQCGTESV
jgi:hypothetical protein